MKKNVQKALTFAAVFSLLVTDTCFAASAPIQKSETVYVTKEADEVKEQVVSVWLHSDQNVQGNDKTDLREIKDLKADQEIAVKDGMISWQEQKKDVYYQGKSDRERPVDVHIAYTLDGKTITNQELKGKSGRLKITISAENKTFTTKQVNGKEQKIYAPYVAVATMTFDEEVAHNIKAPQSKIVKDGKNQILTTILTPGMHDNFGSVLDAEQLDTFRDEAVVEMDVQQYKPIEAYVVISNELFQRDAPLERLDDLKDGLDKLEEASSQLVDASKKLVEAQDKLTGGVTELGEGVHKLHAGAQELDEKTGLLEDRLSPALGQLAALPGAVQQMAQGGARLSDGVAQYTAGVSTIQENMPALVQGTKALQKGASQLDQGIGAIRTATGKDGEGESPLEVLKALRDGVAAQMGDLQQGLSGLSAGANALHEQMGTAAKNASLLAQKEEEMNTPLQAMNTAIQNLPLEALAGLRDGHMEDAFKSIGANVSAMEAATRELSPSIESLEAMAKDLEASGHAEKAERLHEISAQLAKTAEELGAGTANLGQTTENLSASLAPIASLSEQLPNAEESRAFKEGMSEFAAASGGIAAASRQLATGLETLETGAGELANGATKISASVESGSKKVEEELDSSKLEAFMHSFSQLDEALGKLQTGAHALAQGSEQTVEGVDRLAGALSRLDENSASLNEGAAELAGALSQAEEKIQGVSAFSSLQEQGLTPMRAGIRRLTDGLGELEQGSDKLQSGSVVFRDNLQTFSNKMGEFKEKGIDEIKDKTESLLELKTIFDTMSTLAKEDYSFTGVGEGFEAHYRIVEKIK